MLSPHTSYRWRGERDIEPIKCMRSPTHQLQVERRERYRANQVYALTTHQLHVERRERHRSNQVYALTTHQLQVERRESHRANQVYVLTTHQLQVERRERHRANQVKSSQVTLYLYSAFNNTNCIKALHNIKIGKLCQ